MGIQLWIADMIMSTLESITYVTPHYISIVNMLLYYVKCATYIVHTRKILWMLSLVVDLKLKFTIHLFLANLVV